MRILSLSKMPVFFDKYSLNGLANSEGQFFLRIDKIDLIAGFSYAELIPKCIPCRH